MTQAICDITTDEVNVDVVVEPQADTMVEVANRAGGMEQVFHDETLIGNGNSVDLGVNTEIIASKEYVDEKFNLVDTYTKAEIDNKVIVINAEIDANADAIQKTREDFINADSEIHQILNSHANELTTLRGNQASLGDQVSGIEEKIPESASGSNPLITKQQLLDEEMDIRDDLNSGLSELQTQITAQAAEIATKQDKLNAGDNIVISGNTISATGAGGGVGFDMQVVDQLPATGKKGVIYLVPKDGTAPDVHDEYVWIDATQTFELIGTTQVDLTGYVKDTDYANASKAGVVKASENLGTITNSFGYLQAVPKTLETYNAAGVFCFISKGTLENIKDDYVKRGITANTIALTDEEKAAAQAWLGVESGGGDIDISHINNESVVTKDLTVGTSEGTLNLSITAGVATIATNNGLDIVSQTKFDTAPTTDDTTTWANANDTSLVTKRQVATALSESGDCGLIIRRL